MQNCNLRETMVILKVIYVRTKILASKAKKFCSDIYFVFAEDMFMNTKALRENDFKSI